MKCPKCQFENPEDSKFCLKCGGKIELVCPKCGKLLPLIAEFCNECGQNLKDTIEPSAIDYEKPQSYTPKHLADKILTNRSSLEGERKIVTVLFADAANYTSISEKLDPEEILQIMDGAFKIMMDETHKYEGTINQFTGDGIMAIFGAPVAHENHAQRACYTALSIQNAMTDYRAKIEKEYEIDFKIRIGINSGPVIVSAIGDDLRMDYTAVGDTTNLASRMESQADPGTTLVSANTHKIAERYFNFNHIGKTEVKGKKKPQDIYELLKTSEVVTRIDESVAKGLTRFVGRKDSMASLINAYDLVKSGSGQVVGVVGEAGVGKSRLILELLNRLPENEYAYLEGQCLQYGGTILYMPILDIIRSLLDIKDDDREHVIKKKISDKILSYNKNLEHTLPSIQDILSVKVDDEVFLKLEPRQKRERIFEAIRDILISASQERPLIVVVEDLHWIDETSEEFIDYFIEWMANTPILLILLYRTEYRHLWGSKTYYHKIGLDHLQKDSSIELVSAMLKEGDVASELRDLILNRAAGNPLFMEELTKTLIENGTIQKKANQYVLSRQLSDIKVPDTVQGIIAARMDRLEENLKHTMQVASVIGRDFAFRILHTITGMHDELKSYLRNLQGLEFIYEKRLFPELEYIFKHALTQEVAYNSLLLKRRKQIHENIGKAIEGLYSEKLEEFYEMLAYHYSKSDNLEKACHYFTLSGTKAFTNFANRDSFNFYKEAIGLINRMPATEENKREQIEIITLMDNPAFLLAYPEGSLEIFQNGERLAKEIGDKRSYAAFIAHISTYYSLRGEPLEGATYVEPRFYEAKMDQDVDLIAQLSLSLGWSYEAGGDFYKALSILADAIALLEKNNRQNEHFDLPNNLYLFLSGQYGHYLTYAGYLEKGGIFLKKGLASAIDQDDKVIIGLYSYFSLSLYYFKGQGKKALEHAENAIKYCEETNYIFVIAVSWLYSGWAYYILGDLETARNHVEKGYAIQRDYSINWNISWYPDLLGLIHLDSGDIAAAQNYAEEALELSMKYNQRYMEGFSRIHFGRVLGKDKSLKTAETERYLLQGITILEELKMRLYASQGYFYLGELYADIGKYKIALEWLKKAETEFQDMGMNYYLSFAKSFSGRALAKSDLSQFSQAEQAIFDGIKIAENIESKSALALGHFCLGEIYADNEQNKRANENLKKAELMYQEMGMKLYLEKTREVLDRF